MPPAEQQLEAVRRVFETAELLEMVLLDLPMDQLFVVQRIPKTVRNRIAESIKLQRKVWLAPETEKTMEEDDVWNPIWKDSIFVTKLSADNGWASGIRLQYEMCKRPLPIPIMQLLEYGTDTPVVRHSTSHQAHGLVRRIPVHGVDGVAPSWCRMLPSQSTLQTFDVIIQRGHRGYSSTAVTVLSKKPG